jgi:hypothetical protein
MGDVHYLSKRRELFVDDRGHGLQMSWTREHGVVVVSIWHEDSCVGTVRLRIEDAARAAGFLMSVVSEWLAPAQAPEQAATPESTEGA